MALTAFNKTTKNREDRNRDRDKDRDRDRDRDKHEISGLVQKGRTAVCPYGAGGFKIMSNLLETKLLEMLGL